MIQNGKGEVLITNDGATILKNLSVLHPIAKIVTFCEILITKIFATKNFLSEIFN